MHTRELDATLLKKPTFSNPVSSTRLRRKYDPVDRSGFKWTLIDDIKSELQTKSNFRPYVFDPFSIDKNKNDLVLKNWDEFNMKTNKGNACLYSIVHTGSYCCTPY